MLNNIVLFVLLFVVTYFCVHDYFIKRQVDNFKKRNTIYEVAKSTKLPFHGLLSPKLLPDLKSE